MQDWNELMSGKAFITDLGTGKTSVINGEEVSVGQYAVWSPVINSQGHQVIEVGSDLETLMKKYSIPEDRVCRLAADVSGGEG